MKKLAQIKLSVSILKQAKRYIAYSPAFDLSTSGKSEQEAKKRFAEAALLLVEELDKAGTLDEVLKELGWENKRRQWNPPHTSNESIGLRMPIPA